MTLCVFRIENRGCTAQCGSGLEGEMSLENKEEHKDERPWIPLSAV